MDTEILVKQLKAIADEKRLDILKKISKEEKCACVLLEDLDLTQSGLSYHMKLLLDAGIINQRVEGKWTHYSIKSDFSKNIEELLKELEGRS